MHHSTNAKNISGGGGRVHIHVNINYSLVSLLQGPPLLTLTELLQIALDVSQGCAYLERQHFIHRDIAARNCLVSSKGSDRVVKIGDFGLAKDLYTQDYYQVEGQRKLPVRWMAPEALQQGKFTIESDIW